MEILLNEEKEKYFLKLQEGAKLLHHFDIETIITHEEETETSKL